MCLNPALGLDALKVLYFPGIIVLFGNLYFAFNFISQVPQQELMFVTESFLSLLNIVLASLNRVSLSKSIGSEHPV